MTLELVASWLVVIVITVFACVQRSEDARRACVLEVLRERGEADAVSVAAELRGRGFRVRVVAGMYSTLHAMESEGLLVARVGDATAERGWRPRVYYRLAEGS